MRQADAGVAAADRRLVLSTRDSFVSGAGLHGPGRKM